MTQGVLPFKYEEEKKDFGSTGKCGILLYLDLLKTIGFFDMVSRNVRAKESKQGWSDFYFLMCLILLNISGGESVEDVSVLEKDDGLLRLFKHLELRNTWGRHREKLKAKWRNGGENLFPSPSSIFRYLSLFHNINQESVRRRGEAFIPAPNAHLKGLGVVNKEMLESLQCYRPVPIATIDMDATLVESNKRQALYTYKKFKGYQPLNSRWWEQDYLVHSEFRDGNVPAGHDQERVFEAVLDNLPSGVEKVYLRSDSAGYRHKLMKYCDLGENERFKRIEFAICCPVNDEFKKEVGKLDESEWNKLYKISGGVVQESDQEWAELCYVPKEISRSKKGREYRYFVIRELSRQGELDGLDLDESQLQKSFNFPNMKLNNKRYKLSGLVSNLNWYPESIIHWSRERCGNSEHVHGEMKESFCGGQLPSGKFGANAAWWQIMVLAINLVSMLKNLALEKSWKKKRMKGIRFSLINIVGRVIKVEKELIVRLTKGHPSYEIFVKARQRILRLGQLSPG